MSRFVVSVDNDKVSLVDTERDQLLIAAQFKKGEGQKVNEFENGLMYQCNLMNELDNENKELKRMNKELEKILRGE